MTDPAPRIGVVLEMAIYFDEFARAGRFFEENLGAGAPAYLRGTRGVFVRATATEDVDAWQGRRGRGSKRG
jgi:hypothetical protein